MKISFLKSLGVVGFSSLLLSACGGGSSNDSSSNSRSDGAAPVAAPAPIVQTSFDLGSPTFKPAVLPVGAETRVLFTSVFNGVSRPDVLQLDELNTNNQLITPNLAQLLDDGKGYDAHRGDGIYTSSLLISSALAVEKRYRVSASVNNERIQSNSRGLWVSHCAAKSRPSDQNNILLDERTNTTIFSNEVVVTLDDQTTPDVAAINQLLSVVGGEVVGCIPSQRQLLVDIPDKETSEGVYDVVDTLLQQPGFISATPNVRMARLPGQLANNCVGIDCQWYLGDINALQAWSIAGGGDRQRSVAVIDFGVDCDHPELDCDNTQGSEDLIDHGTGVASIIGARRATTDDFAGVAWNAAIYPYNFLDSNGSQYKLNELLAASLSEPNARIVNVSATAAIDPNNQILEALCQTIDSGRLVVVAAGNATTANNCEIDSIIPAQYNTTGVCSNGADLQSGLLVVGASDENSNLAEWGVDDCSNTRHVDIYAPGKDIIAASIFNGFSSKNGTSYATPIVAGGAAVAWSALPELTVAELHNQLISASSSNSQDFRLSGQPLFDLYGVLDGVIEADIDTSPVAFSFDQKTNAAANEFITSDPVVISGLDHKAPVVVSNGFYSINGLPFTNAAGAISNGQNLRLQVKASNLPGGEASASVSVGDFIADFSSSTDLASVSFGEQAGVPLNTIITSDPIAINTITEPSVINIIGGFYSINDAAFTDNPGTINPDDQLTIQLRSASEPQTSTQASLTIGGSIVTYSVETESRDVTVEPINFFIENNEEFENDTPASTVVNSSTETIIGINVPLVISVSHGEYSVDGGPFTRDSGLVTNGQTVTLRHTTAPTFNTLTSTTLTLGDYSTTFSTIVGSEDSFPDAFSFGPPVFAPASTQVISQPVTLTGFNVPVEMEANDDTEVSINGGPFSNETRDVVVGDVVRLRITSSPFPGTTVVGSIVINDIFAAFEVTSQGLQE